MSVIQIKKIVKAIQTSDGAGVKLKRSMGISELDFIDPFLMFDEFGSENKDDYIARVSASSPQRNRNGHLYAQWRI